MVRQWIFYCDFCFAFHGIRQNVLYCRYQLIEDKLKLSKYLSWTFCSCALGRLTLYAFCVDHLFVWLWYYRCSSWTKKISFSGQISTQTILSCKPWILQTHFHYVSGKRKPDTEFYTEVVRHLEVDPSYCIFIDDRFLIFLYISSFMKSKPWYHLKFIDNTYTQILYAMFMY
jgi:hypothetical protein